MYVGNFFDVSKILISTQNVPNLLIDAKMYICRSPIYYYNIISKSLGFIYDSKRSSKPYCSFYLKLNLEAIVWIKNVIRLNLKTLRCKLYTELSF